METFLIQLVVVVLFGVVVGGGVYLVLFLVEARAARAARLEALAREAEAGTAAEEEE